MRRGLGGGGPTAMASISRGVRMFSLPSVSHFVSPCLRPTARRWSSISCASTPAPKHPLKKAPTWDGLRPGVVRTCEVDRV